MSFLCSFGLAAQTVGEVVIDTVRQLLIIYHFLRGARAKTHRKHLMFKVHQKLSRMKPAQVFVENRTFHHVMFMVAPLPDILDTRTLSCQSTASKKQIQDVQPPPKTAQSFPKLRKNHRNGVPIPPGSLLLSNQSKKKRAQTKREFLNYRSSPMRCLLCHMKPIWCKLHKP